MSANMTEHTWSRLSAAHLEELRHSRVSAGHPDSLGRSTLPMQLSSVAQPWLAALLTCRHCLKAHQGFAVPSEALYQKVVEPGMTQEERVMP